MSRWFIIALLVIGGCSTIPWTGPRYILGTPTAEAGTVYLHHDGKMSEDGNTYTIRWSCMTNCNSALQSERDRVDPILATNRWPVRRNHIELSLDGGSNWTRRIGYGVQTDNGRLAGEYVWSPPEDYSLLTTTACLRMTDLDGQPCGNGTNYGFDIPPGQYIQSAQFTIAGIAVVVPGAGDVWYSGNYSQEITWRQAGAGADIACYWITPDTASTYTNNLLSRWTNCVDGVNTRLITTTMPAAPQVEIVLRSMTDMQIIGYSGVIVVDP